MARPPHHSESGEAIFLEQLPLIERIIAFVCARHHLNATEAEDFASHVKTKIIEDGYAVFRKFEGRSSLKSYLSIVVQRMLLDYRAQSWGKWRPSAAAKRGGEVAILLERLIARDGLSFEEAHELMTTNHRVACTREQLEQLLAQLPHRQRRRFESDDALTAVAAPGRPADAAVSEDEAANRVSAALQQVMATLAAQDRLILALRFEDGRTMNDVAAITRLDQKWLFRRVEQLLKQLRKSLEALGVDAKSALQAFESPAVVVDWGNRSPAEFKATGPSLSKGAP